MGKPKKMLTAEDFISAVGKKTEDFYVDVLKGYVRLRPLTVAEIEEARDASRKEDGEIDLNKLADNLLPLSLVEPVLDHATLKQTHVAAYKAIADRIVEICGLSDGQAEAAEKSFRP